MARVEFVDYTGDYPCLCSGEVNLKIDGQVVKFVKYEYESEESGKPYLSLTSGVTATLMMNGMIMLTTDLGVLISTLVTQSLRMKSLK